MTKKSEYDFTVPQRLPPISILFFAYKTLKRFFSLFIYFVIFGLKRFDINFRYLFLLLPVLFVYGYIYYRRFVFYLKDGEFVLEKGVFSRKKLSVNNKRIQVVHLEQPVFHQIFDVYKLRIETAGSSDSEVVLVALEEDKALALKANLLSGVDRYADANPAIDTINTVNKLTVLQLFKSALLINPLSFVSAALFFIYIEFVSNKFVRKYVDLKSIFSQMLEKLPIVTIVVYAIILVLITYLIQIILRTIQYWNFTLIDQPKNFELKYGLFTKMDFELKKSKLQVVEWKTNIISRLLNFARMRFYQATPDSHVKSKKILTLPYIESDEIDHLLDRSNMVESKCDEGMKIRPHYIYGWRKGLILSTFLSLTVLGIVYMTPYKDVVWCLLFNVFILFYFYDYSKYCLVEIQQGVLKVKLGRLVHQYKLGALFKSQSLVLKQSIFQKNRHLATLKISYASGEITVPDIDRDEAIRLYNSILYKVESRNKPWM